MTAHGIKVAERKVVAGGDRSNRRLSGAECADYAAFAGAVGRRCGEAGEAPLEFFAN